MFFSTTLYDTRYRITPWNTRDEISYSLFVNEESTTKEIFDLMVHITPTPEDLTEQDMIYVLYQTYINSTGGDITMKHTCSACGQVNETTVQIGDYLMYDVDEKILEDGEYTLFMRGNDFKILDGNGNQLSELDAEDYLENMDLDVAQKLHKIQANNLVSIDSELYCAICKNIDRHDMSDMYKKDLVKTTVHTLYQLGHDFTYHGRMTLSDYYDMIPFERDIYFSIIEKTREDEAKLNG